MAASGGETHDDARFEPVSTPEAAAREPRFEGTNVCRAAALSLMLGGDREGVRELESVLHELGFADSLTRAEFAWADVDLTEIDSSEELSSLLDRTSLDFSSNEDRVQSWLGVNREAPQRNALAFLIGLLGSDLERESAAAAAVLWRHVRSRRRPQPWQVHRSSAVHDRLFMTWTLDRQDAQWLEIWTRRGSLERDVAIDGADALPWDPEGWSSFYEREMSSPPSDSYSRFVLVSQMAELRLELAIRSSDVVTRSLASAVYSLPARTSEPEEGAQSGAATTAGATPAVSTMIHGTWAWRGDWWRPHGDFHDFVLRHLRPNLYTRGARFSWSGLYREKHRRQAAADFCDWASDVAPDGIQTVFAHSYGGEVAARALRDGAKIAELVLLSTPATGHVCAAASSNVRVVDVRLRFDPVLAIACTRQRLQDGVSVKTVLFDRWTLDHAATHRPSDWSREEVVDRAGL